MFSPGHTLASITYVVGDAAFVHDTLMVPDSGTSRADFPGEAAPLTLQASVVPVAATPLSAPEYFRKSRLVIAGSMAVNPFSPFFIGALLFLDWARSDGRAVFAAQQALSRFYDAIPPGAMHSSDWLSSVP